MDHKESETKGLGRKKELSALWGGEEKERVGTS